MVELLDFEFELGGVQLPVASCDLRGLEEVVFLKPEKHSELGVVESLVVLFFWNDENDEVLLHQIGIESDDLVHHSSHLGQF